MSYSGKYKPTNIEKYKGDHRNIIYRSLWERKFMVYCDSNEKILEWGSEELVIPYKSPLDNKWHRYFPDFYIKYVDNQGNVRRSIIEIKPKRFCEAPKIQSRKSKKYIYEVTEYAKNQAKWKAAKEYCEDRRYEFKILTEDHLRV
jgi:hypothetical protein